MKNGLDPAHLSGSLFNSLTFAFSELMGRSYGGGVLELEPTEAEALPIPITADLDVTQVDLLVRAGLTEDALTMVDDIVLRDRLGLSVRDVERLRGVWMKLRDRRLSRR
jgi:hypothetical protein